MEQKLLIESKWKYRYFLKCTKVILVYSISKSSIETRRMNHSIASGLTRSEIRLVPRTPPISG